MGFADAYLKRHALKEKFIGEEPSPQLQFIVIIPAYNESGLTSCLDSFVLCDLPDQAIEIICLINWSEDVDEEIKVANHNIFLQAREWCRSTNIDGMNFYAIEAGNMSTKHAGVGLARKILMDEAVHRFNQINNTDGIIISCDADCKPEKNFFTAIEEHYAIHPKTAGCNIRFEHDLSEKSFGSEVITAITDYELHMRYYLQSLRATKHPNVFHTLGSSFSVKAKAYCQQGGMNKRQAGEDFYFLQKLFDLGNFSECKETTIQASPRPSSRVPFGTGPVIQSYIETKQSVLTYNPTLFEIIHGFISSIHLFYAEKDLAKIIDDLHPLMKTFLHQQKGIDRILEIKSNSGSESAFRKRFFRWFNMFRMLKFLNSGKSVFQDVPVREAAIKYLEKNKISEHLVLKRMSGIELLKIYRDLEK